MKKNKVVNLYLTHSEPENTTVVEKYTSEEFEDFVIVSIDSDGQEYEDLEELRSAIADTTSKTVILVDRSLDIRMYGVKVDED